MSRIELPTQPGAYRWYYVDVVAGDFTAVFIFMIGSVFSARYSAARERGALPVAHSAVNFALYEKGARRCWVLSEYPAARVERDGDTLRIGESFFSYDARGNLSARVVDRSSPWGRPIDARLEVTVGAASAAPIQLIEGASHFWHPISPRGRARVTLPQHTLDGHAYHDGNFGSVPLGTDCRGWDWARHHGTSSTSVRYQPWGDGPGIQLVARDSSVTVLREPLELPERTRTGWGLSVPSSLEGSRGLRLLESSPFYARLEGETADGGSMLGEVADFERFHRPSIRWMARFRTRLGKVA